MKSEFPLAARGAVRALTASKIRELYNAGIGNPNVLPFWVGEPDEPTPDFIRKAGTDAIAAGELLLEPARAVMRKRALAPARDLVRVVATSFGPESGMLGAALFAADPAAAEWAPPAPSPPDAGPEVRV